MHYVDFVDYDAPTLFSCRATGLPFYLGFILPFLAIYVFNWIVFVMIMVSIGRHTARSAAVRQASESSGNAFSLKNVLIAAGLALVLGLGWGFGLAASSHKISALACTFQFLFSVFVSCQGFLLLLFHGVRSKDAKKVWQSWLCLHTKSYSVAGSTLGEGGTMQSSHLRTMPQTSRSTDEPSISLDEKLCSESEKHTTTEETFDGDATLETSCLGPEMVATEVDVKAVPPKNIQRKFLSLALLKKDTIGGMPIFRSDIQVTKHLLTTECEDIKSMQRTSK